MKRFLFIGITLVLAMTLLAAPATSAGVRHVVVVNLMTVAASVTLTQGAQTPVASEAIASKRDHTFDIPEGKTTLSVSSSVCAKAKLLGLPTQPSVRAVINTGCALSIQ